MGYRSSYPRHASLFVSRIAIVVGISSSIVSIVAAAAAVAAGVVVVVVVVVVAAAAVVVLLDVLESWMVHIVFRDTL